MTICSHSARKGFSNLNFVAFLFLLATCLSLPTWSLAQSAPIALDGFFNDWTQELTSAEDQAEDLSGVDLLEMSVTNDAEYLYIKITTSIAFDMTDNLVNQDIRLYIDSDNDSNTGFAIQEGYGAELGIVFKEHFAHYNVEPYAQVSLSDFSLRLSPTVTSSEFELAISRAAIPDGIHPLFTNPTIKLVLANDSNSDHLPNEGEVFSYTFDDSPVEAYTPIDLTKADPSHIRIVAYNVLSNGLSNTERLPFLESVVSSIDPDIIGFSESSNTSIGQVKNLMDTWIPLGNESGWQVVKKSGSDLITASRWPFVETWNDLERQFPTLIDLPENYPVDLLYTNTHLSCCANDDGRQDQVDAYSAFIQDAKTAGGLITLAEGTPFVYAGDVNFVGFAQQPNTLITGEIQDTNTYGEGSPPDWDGSNVTDVRSLQADIAMDYTWRNDNGSYPPGRLDYMIFSDAVMTLEKGFVLQTESMSDERLQLYSLSTEDTGTASDHFPIVGDFSMEQVSVGEEKAAVPFRMYPNPSDDMVYLEFGNAEHHLVTVVDLFGKVVLQKISGSYKTALPIDQLASGVYFVMVENANGQVAKKRLVRL